MEKESVFCQSTELKLLICFYGWQLYELMMMINDDVCLPKPMSLAAGGLQLNSDLHYLKWASSAAVFIQSDFHPSHWWGKWNVELWF